MAQCARLLPSEQREGFVRRTRAWNDAKKAAGLAHSRFHDLRHEAVSRLVEAGRSGQEVAVISGCKSMQMMSGIRICELGVSGFSWARQLSNAYPLACVNRSPNMMAN